MEGGIMDTLCTELGCPPELQQDCCDTDCC
jgi:hypothetical protein